MNKDKQSILDGIDQYAEFVTKNIPQMKDGKLKYYFSGSVAMLLIMSAKLIQRFSVEEEKLKEKGQVIQVPATSKASFEKGVRKVGTDVDIVEIEEDSFRGDKGQNIKFVTTTAVAQNCNMSQYTFNFGKTNGAYVDFLNYEREFLGHNIACVTLKNGMQVYVVDPIDLIFHKLADGVVTEDEDKRDKDVKDFCSMFNGILPLIKDLDFAKTLEEILYNNPKSAITHLFLPENEEKLKRFYVLCKEYIEKENLESFKNLFSAISSQFDVDLRL